MKHQNKWVPALMIAFCGWLASCKKDVPNIFNMFDVTLELHSDLPNAAAEYNELNAGDSVVIDFTINSPTKDMYQVAVLKTGANTPYIKIPITDEGKRRTYSDKITLKAEKAGETTYRVWAVDKQGVYLGDGYKQITVNVISDYRHLPNRQVYFPDTVGKSLNCYLSLKDATTYSYSTGAASSADIDLGIYRTWSIVNGEVKYRWFIYSLSASPVPFGAYDVSGWTKRATLFASPGGNANEYRDKLATGLAIETEAKKKTINLKSAEVKSGQYLFFKTPDGKYGALMINAITDDYMERPFMNVSVKIQP
ncbi:hypothetical protein [Longitalea luteola]|uniref:hypothetical protein n=1 Tax=Longitalea luteola TaxID=2812563 RepID=UPI001A962E3C|nr:hypothetical protein [Longitalea luteola]